MYDRWSRQPITLQYLITPGRSSQGGPRSLSMDTDHSIRPLIILISLRDICRVIDRINLRRSLDSRWIMEYFTVLSRRSPFEPKLQTLQSS